MTLAGGDALTRQLQKVAEAQATIQDEAAKVAERQPGPEPPAEPERPPPEPEGEA
jgi:hypothetical protein